ncbi:MAG: PKD domain-containing protein [Cyclobacteriaceae bacterium]|nr:PKD domain-containing protein [Cyclobacteriaceae bacterium]
MIRRLTLPCLLLLSTLSLQAQCDALSSRRDIFFTPTFGCAPTTVNRFEITYYFNLPQDPATIQIRYEWNDPGNNVTIIKAGSGLVAGAGNTSFSANATFTYNTNNGQCSIRPTVSVVVNGVVCTTSTQLQTAPFWGTDDQANGVVSITPRNWSVCFGDPVSGATFRDNSQFNCNINVEPDNPNRLMRHVQFVYGTRHNPAATIADLSLNDGAVQPLTDATGNLVAPSTRGTPGIPVTGAYFGPVETIPFPADGPTAVSFPMNAPANVANAVGNKFEITLYNWNVCNPWNGDPLNPNYEDALVTRGTIVIVAAPSPAFDVQDLSGNSKRNFCAAEVFHLANLTPNLSTYLYRWDFFDDAAGTLLLETRTGAELNYAYTTGGTKLIRLRARNPGAKGTCETSVSIPITVLPTLKAAIAMTDSLGSPITGNFCQQPSPPLSIFPVYFQDVSTGTPSPGTQWQWQFTDASGVVTAAVPSAGFANLPDTTQRRDFQSPGTYAAYLTIRDAITGCISRDTAQVHVFVKPTVDFLSTAACEGDTTQLTDISQIHPIAGDTITQRDWDFQYNGSSFSPDPAAHNLSSVNHTYAGPGLHQAALQLVTSAGCSALVTRPVALHALPQAAFQSSAVSGCGSLPLTLQDLTTPRDSVTQEIWQVDQHDGMGFRNLQTFNAGDNGFFQPFNTTLTGTATNAVIRTLRLQTTTRFGCTSTSDTTTIVINPVVQAAFSSANYSPFNNNCSPLSIQFNADPKTTALNPLGYHWRVFDSDTLFADVTGGSPSFNYQFVNQSDQVRNFQVALGLQLTTGCSRDSVVTVRISPVPHSGIELDTLSVDCNAFAVRATVRQSGLAQYRWGVLENNILVSTSNGTADFIEHTFTRQPDGAVLSGLFTLSTQNMVQCQSDTTQAVIDIPPQEVVVASFTTDSLVVHLPNASVAITNLSAGNNQATYHWDFGDGASLNSPQPGSHAYNSPGRYPITLTVTGSSCSDQQIQSIVVRDAPPVIDYSADKLEGCAPLAVRFTNQSTHVDTTSFAWDFGPGEGTSSLAQPSHVFTQPGTFTVELSATNPTGEMRVTVRRVEVTVWPTPRAAFRIRPEVVYAPDGIVYTSNESFDADHFLWDFGDGQTDTLAQPQHRYQKEGQFTIALIATNVHGCADTVRVASAVTVKKDGRVLIPNAFSPSVDHQDGGSSNGKNDIFLPMMRGVTQFEMMIFNRWGQLLFQSNNPQQGWDGYFNGQLCEQDVYVYKISVTFESGEKSVSMGDVNLIR